MKDGNLKLHRNKSEGQENSQWSSDSSAVRWSNSSASPDSFATIIRDSVFIVVDEDFEPGQKEPHVGSY